ncbi:MAG: hypothetical protein KGJ84_08130 [Elusimicrobia bacterium]|nr:hypothetical protein [Elusimicrobiota bacterium]
MKLLLLILLLSLPAAAKDAKDDGGTASKETVELVKYFLKIPLSEASTKLIDPFLAVKTDTLPEKLRGKAAAKQIEIGALLRVHERKKAGSLVYPDDNCDEKSFVKPLSMAPFFSAPSYERVTEDELKYVMDRTRCTEIDLGCRFSLLIFFQEKKERILKFVAADPIMGIVAESHGGGGGGGSRLFGIGITCEH